MWTGKIWSKTNLPNCKTKRLVVYFLADNMKKMYKFSDIRTKSDVLELFGKKVFFFNILGLFFGIKKIILRFYDNK